MRRLGLAFTGQPYRIPEIVAAAQEAESLGFDSIWVAEDFWTGREAISILTALAMSTQQIKLGTCVINILNRHPTIIAMTYNTLSDLAPDRLIIGLGAGGRTLRALAGDEARAQSPLRQMRQVTADIRSLTTGGEATYGDEKVWLGRADSCWSIGSIPPVTTGFPIYFGATGPRMTELTGEIADGLLFEIHTRPDQVPARIAQVATGARRAGRDPGEIDIAAAIVASVSDGGEVDEATRCWAAGFVARLSEEECQSLGFDPERSAEIRRIFQSGQRGQAAELLSRDMITSFAIAGTPANVLSGIQEYVDAGVQLPILVPFERNIDQLLQVGAKYIHESVQSIA